MIDIVFPYVESLKKSNEIIWAIRSIEKNCSEEFRIIVIGDQPTGLDTRKYMHIPHVKAQSPHFPVCYDACSKMSVILNHPEINDRFIINYDDIYWNKPNALEIIHDMHLEPVYIDEISFNKLTRWHDLLNATGRALQANGIAKPLNFETHMPRLVYKPIMNKIYKDYNPMENRLLHFTLYGNHLIDEDTYCEEYTTLTKYKAGFYGFDSWKSFGAKTYKEVKSICDDKIFINHNNEGLSGGLEKYLNETFNKKSTYEK